jgi:hypothetical protein
VSTTLKYQRYADAQDAAVTVEEAKPPRFRGDRDEPKVAITLSLNEADALLTGSEAAAIRAINNSRVAHRRYDDFSLAAKILERVGEIAQQVDDATRGERY